MKVKNKIKEPNQKFIDEKNVFLFFKIYCRRSTYATDAKEKLAFCKCKRSGCIRNYCHCYDQKRVCGASCRCNSKFHNSNY